MLGLETRRKLKKPSREDSSPLPVVLAEAEKEKAYVLSVYRGTGENQAETAKQLDIGLITLRRKLPSYSLE